MSFQNTTSPIWRTLLFCHCLKSKIHYGGHSNACAWTASSAHRGVKKAEENRRGRGQALGCASSSSNHKRRLWFLCIFQTGANGSWAGRQPVGGWERGGRPSPPTSCFSRSLPKLKRGRKIWVEASPLSCAGFLFCPSASLVHSSYR